MIDFTDNNHKKGVMILSSKDVRTVDKNLMNYDVQLSCADFYIKVNTDRIKNLDIDPSVKDAILIDLGFVHDDLMAAKKYIDKVQDVFR